MLFIYRKIIRKINKYTLKISSVYHNTNSFIVISTARNDINYFLDILPNYFSIPNENE